MAHDTRGIARGRAMAEMGLQCSMQVAECGGGHGRSRHHMGCAGQSAPFWAGHARIPVRPPRASRTLLITQGQVEGQIDSRRTVGRYLTGSLWFGLQQLGTGDCQCAEWPSYVACSRRVVCFAQVFVALDLGVGDPERD